MRVVLFSRNACAGDAIGQQVLAKLRYFQEQDAHVRLFLSEDRDLHPEIKAADPIVLSARQIWNDPELRRELGAADWLFAEFGSAYDLMDLLPALAGKGPRIVVDYHGLTPFASADPALFPEIEAAQNQRRLLWCADAVLVQSRFAQQELQEAIGIPDERIHRFPCWVNPAPVSVTKEEPERRRRQFSLSDAHVILFVGRLAKNKQPEIILKAIAQLPPMRRPVHVVYLGDQGDIYVENRRQCQDLARRLGLEGQVHFLGKVADAEVDAWYSAADVLVLPSLHEGFGMPVVEAMARGLPVICSDQAALPETLGHAGLTFSAGDSDDLARQLQRLFEPPVSVTQNKRIALVSHRFGTGFAGGAEASLRTMAEAWRLRGWDVEIFSTCNQHESNWRNSLPAGATRESGFLVHRFPIDSYDAERLGNVYAAIRRGDRSLADLQEEYLANSLGSEALIRELARRRSEFAAIVTGPYLFKLTYQVAKQFTRQVLLAPCFHDEPLAYLPAFRQIYRKVGGVFFHSHTETRFAAERLTINHPHHAIVGTFLPGEAFARDDAACRTDKTPYLVYCGRYCPEKALGELIEWMDNFQARHPDKLRLVCMGQGPTKLPQRSWLSDLGFISEAAKRQVLANAFALMNLSPNESLSIVVLEAWALQAPVVVSQRCAVLCEQTTNAQGGAIAQNYEAFEAVLLHWLERDDVRKDLGRNGCRFVKKHYASSDRYADRLEQIVETLQKPLDEIAKQKSLERAQDFSPTAWKSRLAQILKDIGSRASLKADAQVEITTFPETLQLRTAQESIALTVRLLNLGGNVLPNQGPGRVRLRVEMINRVGFSINKRPQFAPFPETLIPGQGTPVVVTIRLPRRIGKYQVCLSVVADDGQSLRVIGRPLIPLHMVKTMRKQTTNEQPLAPLLQSVRQILAQAHRLERLPEDYVDVTEGKFSAAKRLIKRKLLNNFRRAYVDVAFRQQSALNQKLISVMNLLLESSSLQSNLAAIIQLQSQVRKLQRQCRREREQRKRLERRLDAMTTPEFPA